MWRLYFIGIIYWIMILNIPEVRSQAMYRIQIYKPAVEETVKGLSDKYTPAMKSLITDLIKSGQTTINGKIVDKVNNIPVDTTDSWSMTHQNSITADQFDTILREYQSPAVGLGAMVTAYSQSKNIDNAYILYMYIHESTAGTKGIAVQTKSTGNIRCYKENCIDGFQAYSTIEYAFQDHIDLLTYYRDELGDQDIIAALERWAPATENNQAKDCELQQRENRALSYPCGLMVNVTKWRQLNAFQPKVVTTIETGNPIAAITPATFILPADKEVKSLSLPLSGCIADTVPNALNPSPGLQEFAIAPGKDWSFNEQWVIINPAGHYCGGVEYGGVCDMASQYQMVARQLGLDREYGRHPGGLYNIPYDDTVVIWSNNRRGGQDLRIINNTTKMAIFRAQIQNGVFTVSGWLE